jgi:hypothetical protein
MLKHADYLMPNLRLPWLSLVNFKKALGKALPTKAIDIALKVRNRPNCFAFIDNFPPGGRESPTCGQGNDPYTGL